MASTVSGGGSGPPSISATEASTTQVLEEIRRRTQVAQQEVQPIPVSNTTAAASAPGSSSATVGQQQATTSAAQSQAAQTANAAAAKPKPNAPAAEASAPAAETYSRYASLKDYGSTQDSNYEGAITRTRAVWGQGFAGYEHHSNLAPGNEENPTRNQVNGGGMVGADWTAVRRGGVTEAFQFGVFSGYSETNNHLSTTQFDAPVTDQSNATSPATFSRSNNTEDINGPFVGAYLAYVRDAWTFDVAFKTDFFDLTQSSTLSAINGCTMQPFSTVQQGSASIRDYVVAAEAARRSAISATSWIEPTIGIRFTYTDFSHDTSVTPPLPNSVGTPLSPVNNGSLGLDDGSSLRLQVGARYGDIWTSPQGYLLTTTLGAFLYSDVLITGFNGSAGISGQPVGPVDEGKLRGLGQITSKLDVGSGLSYLFLAEVYGGQDEVGVDGQLGARYQW